MYSNQIELAAPTATEGGYHILRQPLTWVLIWAAWSLLALAWFGYQDALAGLVCSTS